MPEARAWYGVRPALTVSDEYGLMPEHPLAVHRDQVHIHEGGRSPGAASLGRWRLLRLAAVS